MFDNSIDIKAVFELNQREQVFENAIEALYSEILKPGDKAIDGGAHHGRHTYPMASLVGSKGMVHAFEVLPPCVASFRERVEHRTLPQLILHDRALAPTSNQTSSFRWVKNAWGHSGLRERDHGSLIPDIVHFDVQTLAIDDLPPEQTERTRFIKLDLEGGEFDALKGGERLLQQWKPVIAFENGRAGVAKHYGYTEDDFFNFFESLGYELLDIFSRPFTRGEWLVGDMPWDFIAVADSDQSAFIKQMMPRYFSECLAKRRSL